MINPTPHTLRNQTFWISPERCLYWEEQNTLILADLHLGKSGHFRKEGIAVPQDVYKADLQRLIAQLYLFKTERLIIAGDFTHSSLNRELDLFLKWRKDFSSLQIDLVLGNHDILNSKWYTAANVTTHEWKLPLDEFIFLHDPNAHEHLEGDEKHLYAFTGHLHPGISIRGRGRQSLTFPCFYFAHNYCVLPAFSKFTGTSSIKPSSGETAYAIAGKEILKIC
jgi:DNA ligase-associated metallophosphoesterase